MLQLFLAQILCKTRITISQHLCKISKQSIEMKTRKKKTSERSSSNLYQHQEDRNLVWIMFGFRENVTFKRIFEEYQVALRENAPCFDAVYKWLGRFKTSNISVKSEPHDEGLKASIDNTNVAAVKAILDEDLKITLAMIASTLGIRILNKSLGSSMKHAHSVPKILSNEETGTRVCFAKFFLERFNYGTPENCKNLITSDKTFIYV